MSLYVQCLWSFFLLFLYNVWGKKWKMKKRQIFSTELKSPGTDWEKSTGIHIPFICWLHKIIPSKVFHQWNMVWSTTGLMTCLGESIKTVAASLKCFDLFTVYQSNKNSQSQTCNLKPDGWLRGPTVLRAETHPAF